MRRWSNRGGRTSVLAIPMRCSFRPGSPCFHTLDHRPLSPFCPLFLLSCSRLRWSIPLPFPPFVLWFASYSRPPLCHSGAGCVPVIVVFSGVGCAPCVSLSSRPPCLSWAWSRHVYLSSHLDPHSRASLTLFLSASVSLAFNTASLIYFHRSQPHPFASVQLRHVVILPANLLLAQSSMGYCVRGETEG